MAKSLTAEQELDAAFVALAKSRGGNADEALNREPAIPTYVPGTDADEQREDNRAVMDAQYGATEPRDRADEAATRRSADRQRNIFGGDETDLAASKKGPKAKAKGEEPDDGDDDDDDELEKAVRRLMRGLTKAGRDAATRAIEDSQDAYLRPQRGDDGLGGPEDDDVHGEPERFPHRDLGSENANDGTIITNLGRRVRPEGAAKKSLAAYQEDVLAQVGDDAGMWDGNPGLTALADVIGAHLEKSTARWDARLARLERGLTTLAQDNDGLARKLDKSLRANAALIAQNGALQKSLTDLSGQPVDFPMPGVIALPVASPDARSQAPARGGKGPGLTKSQLRGRLMKALKEGTIEPGTLRDFDNQVGKGVTPAEWGAYALSDIQRAACGLAN